jgi:hypothetical protein
VLFDLFESYDDAWTGEPPKYYKLLKK